MNELKHAKGMKKLMIIIKKIISYCLFIIYPLLTRLSIKPNLIVFESFLGRKINDNPRAIFEYMYENYPDYEYVWVVDDVKNLEIEGASTVKRMSIKYFFTIARAKYIVNNSRMPKFYKKRSNQVYIQTWHGTPLKRLVHDMKVNTMPRTNHSKYLKEFSNDVKQWDFLVSANSFSTEKFKTAFKYDGAVIESGYPRNEQLHHFTDEQREQYRAKYGLDEEDVVILYTPTYRDNHNQGQGNYLQEMKLDLDLLNQTPGIKVMLRLHYLISQEIDVEKYENIIDVSNENNINELYIASDVLLTDYSSTMFDYLILDKPIILFPYDLEAYSGEIRGFYMSYNKIPAEQIEDTTRLIEIAGNVKGYKALWSAEYQEFKNEMVLESEKEASKIVVEKMFNAGNQQH